MIPRRYSTKYTVTKTGEKWRATWWQWFGRAWLIQRERLE